MKINYIILVLTTALLGTSCVKEFQDSIHVSQKEQQLEKKLVGVPDGAPLPGSVLMKVDESTVKALEEGRFADISGDIFGNMPVISLTRALPIRPKNTEVAKKYGLHQWYKVAFDTEIKPEVFARQLAKSARVRSIQYRKHLTPTEPTEVYPFSGVPVTKSSGELLFNDPYSANQWNLYNDGKSVAGAVEGADIGVKDAWRLTGGDNSVIVAIFDCGLPHRHEDLKDAMWRNELEISGSANVDDDGNGFIDDKYGFNFVGCNAITTDYVNGKIDGAGQEVLSGRSLSSHKGVGHGTHVAGIIGATNGNGLGVSSIAGGTGNGDGVRLMSCQIFEGNEYTVDEQTAAAFIYAADNGACIAQCSYGNYHIITDDDTYLNGGIADDEADISASTWENLALRYFLDPANSNHPNLQGNMAIFAAGNHQNPYSIYPGALDYVISVTAFGHDFLPGGYSNYGPGCNISAPGGEWNGIKDDYSSMILSTGVSNAATQSPQYEFTEGKYDPNYVYMQGTSMACPHVSGVVALGIAYAKKLGKTLTREQMTSYLLTSVNDIDQYLLSGTKKFYDSGLKTYVDIPLNQYYGKMGTGALDAWKFLMAIEGTPSVMVKAGEKAMIDLSAYCNPSDEYALSIDEASRSSLGLITDPVINDGFIEIECTAVGAGKITLSASVGKDPQKENGIGGMNYTREISIVSRPFATQNGGWL